MLSYHLTKGDMMRSFRYVSGLILVLFSALFVLSVAAQDEQEQEEEETSPEGVTAIREDIGIYVSLSYQVLFEADSVVTIAVRSNSNSLNPMLIVTGPDGELLAENDDHASSFTALLDTYDALLEAVSIPETGIYTIRVYNQFWSIGAVDLIVIEDDVVPLADILRAISAGSVTPSTRPVAAPLRTTGPCTARGGLIPANLRREPALRGRVERLLHNDESLGVSGFYNRGGDGFTWYLVGGHLWAREDAIILEGDCSNLSAR